MKRRRPLTFALIFILMANLVMIEPVSVVVAGGGLTRQIPASGSTSLSGSASAEGSDAIQQPEFAGGPDDGEAAGAGGASPQGPDVTNRSYSDGKSGNGPNAASGKSAKSNPEVLNSFNGLYFRQQRLANGGNQFSVEPPDQGLCAGNGYLLESVNDVLRVFDTSGNPLTGVIDLNSFYGYIPAINRTTGVRGPFVTDPSCHFDTDTQRWFQVVLTLEVNSRSGAFLGPNHIDIAVSQTADPTGAWNIYRLPVQDDGTQGTPNHGCSGGPCIGDYPHIGADANGFYVTTNEYPFFDDGFIGAQVYAFSKYALASGAASVGVTQFNTAGMVAGNPGFTVWPSISPAGQNNLDNGGTEFFLSSNAAEEANGTGTSNQIAVWKLVNTSSLGSNSPALSLSNKLVTVNPYAVPPPSNQKAGDFPLGQCINDTTTVVTSLGAPFTGCWKALFGAEPAHNEVLSHLDSNDTRMQQVFYANGNLWGALDTAVTVNGVNKAGIAWYIINPNSNKLVNQGYLAMANNNVTYPAIAVTSSGRGVMAFTLVGGDYYPSAGYASIDAANGVGAIHVAAAGLGPQDGFTGYKAEVGNPPRPRWGDYGAAAVDGNNIWMASEYIAQTCTLAQYEAAPFGSCGGTRATLGNWATRITGVSLK